MKNLRISIKNKFKKFSITVLAYEPISFAYTCIKLYPVVNEAQIHYCSKTLLNLFMITFLSGSQISNSSIARLVCTEWPPVRHSQEEGGS